MPGAWRVRRSRRARRLSLHVLPNGMLEIVVPRRVGSRAVREFVESNRAWIEKHAPLAFTPIRPVNPAQIPLHAIGQTYRAEYFTGVAPRVAQDDGVVTVTAPDIRPRYAWPLLRRWLKSEGRRRIPGMLAEVADGVGVAPAGLQVRLQRTRWGSCSSRGIISVNAAGLFLGPRQFRYLLTHELCHLKHMNHSKRFWSAVAASEPDYEALDRALNAAWRSLPDWVYT